MHIKQKDSWIKHIDFLILDLLVFILSAYLSYYIKFKTLDLWQRDAFRIVLVMSLLVNITVSLITNHYSAILKRRWIKEIKISLSYTLASLVGSSIILFLFKMGFEYSRQVFIVTFVLYFVLSVLFREAYKLLLLHSSLTDKNSYLNLLVVTDKERAKELVESIVDTDTFHEYNIMGVLLTDGNKKNLDDVNVVGSSNDLLDYVRSHNVNEVLICTSFDNVDKKQVQEVVNLNVAVHLNVDDVFGYKPEKAYSSKVGIFDTFAIGLHTFSYTQTFYLFFKRLMDIFFSIIGIIILGILCVFIKIANIITKDKGPLFYTHTRIGKNGVPYKLYKFRSMSIDADEILKDLLKDPKYKKEWDEYQKFDDDPRITKVGKFLRKTSFDEFPQFINIFKGDMSLVGPRPLVPGELESHGGIKLYEQVKPGLTSWWAANGRSEINYDDRLNYEYYYVRNMSLALDLKAILKTAAGVLLRKGSK